MSDKTTERFLEHILAHPEDDTPRLVFADWLEEHGDSDRAEFIRVQIERARLPKWDVRQVALRLRERTLFERHAAMWRAELPSIEGILWDDFRRGFVATVLFTNFTVLRERANACGTVAPIEEATALRWPRRDDGAESLAPISGLRELTISAQLIDRDDVGRLADLPLLSTLRALHICRANLGGGGFRRLMASPHLGNLEALRVPGNAIGQRAIRALYDAASLTSLTELDLSETGSYGRTRGSGRSRTDRYYEDPVIEAADMASLARWPGMARLRILKLSGNAIGSQGLRALLSSPHAGGLKELTLCANSLEEQDMKEFGAAVPELQLDVLDLGENLVGDVGASDLALASCLRELKVLELDRCEIRSSGARWLIYAPFLASLRRLNVNHNSFGAEALYRLLEMKPQFLHTLEMSDNDLGDEGAAHLAEARASSVLRLVNLAHNGLHDQSALYLGKSKHLKNLLVLLLEDNEISERAIAALADSPLGKRLTVLDVGETEEAE